MTKSEKRIKWYAAGLTGVAIVAFAALGFLWAGKLELQKDNTALLDRVDDLSLQADSLTAEIDSLMGRYHQLALENQSLKGSVTNANEALAAKDAQLANIKRQSARDSRKMKQEIEQLRQFKAGMEADMGALRSENQALHEENTRLTRELSRAKQENGRLASRINELEMNQPAMEEISGGKAPIQASAFRVEVEKRSEKLTVSSRQARMVEVSFDLINIPERFQGLSTIYLAVVNGKGLPVKGVKNKNVELQVDGQPLPFETQEWKEVNLINAQRLVFNVPLDEKIKPGYYMVRAYNDLGMLGSVGFRLR